MAQVQYRPSSIVVTDSNCSWEDQSYLIPHEALRWLFQEIQSSTSAEQLQSQPWKLPTFHKWYSTVFAEIVHHHHDAEEKIYVPWIMKQLQTETKPGRVAEDHVELLARMKEITDMQPVAENAATLSQKLEGLRVHMLEHLAEEERMFPALLRQAKVTEKENNKVVDKIVKQNGLRGNKLFLPVILYAMETVWLGPEPTKLWLKANVPAPIRMFNSLSWKKHFERNTKLLFECLRDPNCTAFPPKK
jgi:hypothetical protein